MLNFPRWKIIAILLICLNGIVLSLPNFFTREQVDTWPSFAPKSQIPLGLDLQGGAHLLLGMDSEKLKSDWLKGLRDQTRTVLRDAKPKALIPEAAAQVVGSSIQLRMAKAEEVEPAVRELRARLSEDTGNPLLGTSAPSLDIRSDGLNIVITPTAAGIRKRLTDTASAAIETVNRRVNALGTAESTVVRQGDDRILIQYPGLKDTEELKELIGQTAKLSFHDVHPSMTAEEAERVGIPTGYKIYPSAERPDERAAAEGNADRRRRPALERAAGA